MCELFSHQHNPGRLREPNQSVAAPGRRFDSATDEGTLMATEVWFPGVKPGWLSGLSLAEITVTAELDGIDIVYRGTDADVLKHAFFHAALRTVLRRFLPWIAPPITHKHFD